MTTVKLVPQQLTVAQRRLSPRVPYQESPLSYIGTPAHGWAVCCENDTLQWIKYPPEAPPAGEIQFVFWDLAPGKQALATIELVAYTTSLTEPGTLGVRSSASDEPRTFTIGADGSHTLDILLTPSLVIEGVIVEVLGGIEYLEFKEIKLVTLT